MSSASKPPGDDLSVAQLTRSGPNPAEFRDVRQALENDSPRAAALLGAAHLDFQLEQVITQELVARDQADYDKLFRSGGGPMSSTEAKVHLAYCMGIFGEITKADLQKICKIRNIFAHSALAVTFDTMAIKNLCLELKALTAYREKGLPIMKYSSLDHKNPRLTYIQSCVEIPMALSIERKMTIVNGIRTMRVELKVSTPLVP